MVDYNEVLSLTKGLKVLFVEDDKNFRKETSDVLKNLFYKLDISVDGRDALEKYTLYHEKNGLFYDIVITDIKMPNMDGIELTKELYKLNPNQPVVIVSTYNEVKYLMDLINIGVDQFIVKPLEFDNVLEVIYSISKNISHQTPNIKEEIIIELNNSYYWDMDKMLLFYNDDIVNLTLRELLLMKLFIKNKNKVSSYDEIFNIIWEDNIYLASVQSLKPIVSRLRKKIPFQKIESVSGLGYRLLF